MLDSYIRVSRVDGREGDSYIAVDEQRRMIQEFADRHGVTLGLEVIDEDVSGSRRASERGLGALLERAESGQSQGIIVAWQDRLSRGSLREQVDMWERLEKAGARFVSAGDGVDTNQPGQKLLFNIRASIANDQWDRYRANWMAASRNAVERGLHSGEPLGYQRTKTGLVLDEKADLVRQAFAQRADGESFANIARFLGLTNKAVRELLRNKAYLGQARGAGGAVNEAAHEPLVSRVVFERAQVAKTTSLRAPRNGNCTGKLVAQGIATCGSCGNRLQTSYYKIKSGYGLRYQCVNYQCKSRARIQGWMLDGYLDQEILSRLSIAGRTLWTDAPKTDLTKAKASLVDAERARDEWIDNAEAIGLIGKDRWNKTLRKLTARADAAAALLAEEAEVDEIEPAWTTLGEKWRQADVPERRDLLRKVVGSITVASVGGVRGIPASERVRVEFKKRTRPIPALVLTSFSSADRAA
jgi:DNA invertase Pin-like site-specific DNA recombinase